MLQHFCIQFGSAYRLHAQGCTLDVYLHMFFVCMHDVRNKLILYVTCTAMMDRVEHRTVGLQGTESFCCEECLVTVVAAGVRIHFHTWESPNGTTDQRGQFPELYIRAM